MSLHTLPPDSLSGPAPPEITKAPIDWTTTPLPEYATAYATVLDNVLTPSECTSLIGAAEASNANVWDQALVRSGQNTMRLATDVRNSSRILWDSHTVASRLWTRVAPHLMEIHSLSNQPKITGPRPVRDGEIWDVVGLNERLRFLKYGEGEYFKPHEDGAYERPRDPSSSDSYGGGGGERTMFTLHLYLNEADAENPLVGGATTFHHIDLDGEDAVGKEVHVVPKIGRVLVFQHKGLLHSGQEVESGIKITLRTDLLFRRRKEVLPLEERVEAGPRVKSKYQYWAKREAMKGGGGDRK